MRTVSLSHRLNAKDWPTAARLAIMHHNNSPSAVRGGLTAAQIFLGRKPIAVEHLIPGLQPPIDGRRPLPLDQVVAFATELEKRMESDRATAVEASESARTKAHALRAHRRDVQSLNVKPDDWVLVSYEAGAPVRGFHKLNARWWGPVQVVEVLSESRLSVREFGTEDVRSVHSAHVQFFHNKNFVMTAEAQDWSAQTLLTTYFLEDILDVRKSANHAKGPFVCKVKWAGYPVEEESLKHLFEQDSDAVRSYLDRTDLPKSVKSLMQEIKKFLKL